MGHTEECILLICAIDGTLTKYSPWAGLGRSVQMQRKLNLGNNGCKECAFLMSISKMMTEIKVSWMKSQKERLSERDETSASRKPFSRPAPGSSNPAALQPQCVKEPPADSRTCRLSEPVFPARSWEPASLMSTPWFGCRGWSAALGESPSRTFQTGFHSPCWAPSTLGQPVVTLNVSTISVTFQSLCFVFFKI